MIDFYVMDEGTLFLLQPISDQAESWIKENIDEAASRFGTAVVVEHRYIEDIINGIKLDGLSCVLLRRTEEKRA